MGLDRVVGDRMRLRSESFRGIRAPPVPVPVSPFNTATDCVDLRAFRGAKRRLVSILAQQDATGCLWVSEKTTLLGNKVNRPGLDPFVSGYTKVTES